MQIYDVSSVSPVSLMLFGQSFSESIKSSRRSKVVVNGWIHLHISELHAAIIRRIQSEIQDLLIAKVENPHLNTTIKQDLIIASLKIILTLDICE